MASTRLERSLRIRSIIGCSVNLKRTLHSSIPDNFGRPALHSIFQVWYGVLNLENYAVSAKLGLICRLHSSSAVIIVLHKRKQGLVQLFSLLLRIIFVVWLIGPGQLMKGQNVESCNALVGFDGDGDLSWLANLLDRKVVANSSCPVPDEVVDISQ